jgi:hypothetical protein
MGLTWTKKRGDQYLWRTPQRRLALVYKTAACPEPGAFGGGPDVLKEKRKRKENRIWSGLKPRDFKEDFTRQLRWLIEF